MSLNEEERKLLVFYLRLQSIREKADYSLSWNAEDFDLQAAIGETRAFLDHIKQHVNFN